MEHPPTKTDEQRETLFDSLFSDNTPTNKYPPRIKPYQMDPCKVKHRISPATFPWRVLAAGMDRPQWGMGLFPASVRRQAGTLLLKTLGQQMYFVGLFTGFGPPLIKKIHAGSWTVLEHGHICRAHAFWEGGRSPREHFWNGLDVIKARVFLQHIV